MFPFLLTSLFLSHSSSLFTKNLSVNSLYHLSNIITCIIVTNIYMYMYIAIILLRWLGLEIVVGFYLSISLLQPHDPYVVDTLTISKHTCFTHPTQTSR